jgi:hypothetical protein
MTSVQKITSRLLSLVLACGTPMSYLSQAFEKVYASYYDRTSRDIMRTADGGYLLVGSTNNSNPSDADLYVLRTDGNGEKLWDTIYGGGKPDYAYSMIDSDDGNFIVAGYTQSFGGGDYDIYLLKLNQGGKLMKQVNFGTTANEEARQIIKAHGGGYLVVGTTGLGSADSKITVIKVNNNLDNVGEWHFNPGTARDYGLAIEKTSDGGYLVGGQTHSMGQGDGDGYVIKLKSDMSKEWEQTYGNGFAQEVVGLVTNSDGSFAMAVRDSFPGNMVDGNINVTVIKANTQGAEIWSETFGGTDKDTPKTIRRHSSGYLVGAISRSDKPAPDMWIFMLNENGIWQWGRSYGDYFEHDHCHMAKSSEGGILAVGHQRKPVMSVYFLKLDEEGYVSVPEAGLAGNGLQIWPNPSKGRIQVSGDAKLLSVSVTDVMGRQLPLDQKLKEGNGRYEISLDGQPAGVYLLSLRTDAGEVTQKVMIE